MNLISIGRSRECDYVVDSESCSKTHAYLLQGKDGSFLLIDRASFNGTRVREGNEILRIQQRKIGLDEQFFVGKVQITPRQIISGTSSTGESSTYTTIRDLDDGQLIRVKK